MPKPASDIGLNDRAILALFGHSADWRGDLLMLLRSDEPIGNSFRIALADLIDGKSPYGISLDLKGHKRNRDVHAGIISRRKWVEIGHWIELQIRQGTARYAAVLSASAIYPFGEKGCDAALDYSRRFDDWFGSIDEDHPFMAVLGPTGTADLFHTQDARGLPLDIVPD